MSGYPNYNSPQGWKPPVPPGPGFSSSGSSASFGPQFVPPGSLPPNNQKKPPGGGSGCALAAFIVFIVIGVPLIAMCAGVVYLGFMLRDQAEVMRAKAEQDQARLRDDMAKGFPNGNPGAMPPLPGFPFEQPKGVASAQDAIDALISGDWQRQRQGAEWLAKNPAEEAKREAAAKALEGALTSFHGDVAENSLKALEAWGTPENSPAVIAAMKDHRINRKLAIEQLGRWKFAAAAPALAELLDDGGTDGEAAFKALEEMGAVARPAILVYLDPARPVANQRAERLLEGLGVDLADATLTARLAKLKTPGFHRADVIKSLAAMPLQAERQKEVARALDAVLAENDRQARDEALAALLVWGDKESIPGVVRYLKSETFVNKNAIRLLGQLQDPQALEPLVALLDNSFADDIELNQALAAFGAEGEKAVLKSFHDSRRRARDRARTILTTLDAKPDALLSQTLADLSAKDDQRARSALEWLATATVDESRRKEVSGKLVAASRSPSPFVQGAAVEALVNLNDPATLPDLLALFNNPNTKGRLSAAFFKAGPAAEDLLIGLLEQEDQKVLTFACMTLNRSGTQKSVKPLQDVLRKAEEKDRSPVRLMAKSALDAIQKRTGG